MEAGLQKRGLGWVFTAVVLAVVLMTGSRLIYLSAQHHAALARARAASVGAGLVAKIETRLRQLAARPREALRQADIAFLQVVRRERRGMIEHRG